MLDLGKKLNRIYEQQSNQSILWDYSADDIIESVPSIARDAFPNH